MKIYLVTEKVDYCGYEVKRTFANEEYARNYARMFGFDIEEMEITETDIVEEHRYYKIEYDLLLSAYNTVAVIGRHKYPCQWSEYNSEFGTWEITEQGENDVLIGKIAIYALDSDDKIDHERVIESCIKEINWFQRDLSSANNEPRRIQVGDGRTWLRPRFLNEILTF